MKKITITSLAVLWAFIYSLHAADLVKVLPVTNKIIMVQYDEGHIDYNGVAESGNYKTGPFEGQTTNKVYYSPLDVEAALSEINYSISSSDDPNYSSPLNPNYIGYKAKGTEFNAPNKYPQFLKEYKMYVVLPHALESGNTYTIQLNGLADNTDSYTFVFDEKTQRSPTIHVNQIGFEPDQPKYAYLSQWMGNFNYNGQDSALDLSGFTANDYYLYDLESKIIVKTYSNNISVQIDNKENSTTEAKVYSCDFSDFNTPGKYVLVLEGIGCSYPFEIRRGIYREPFYASMRGMYYSRQGIVKRADEFDNKVYPRSQHPDDVQYYYDGTQKSYHHDVGGFDFSSNPVDGIWGHYYDAGDWDHYSENHWKVPMFLLMLYDVKPGAFADGDIGNNYKYAESDQNWVDEGNNDLPDLLDEGKWLVEFYKRTKDALIDQGYGTGGVPSYVGADAGATDKPSWADKRKQPVKAEIPGATFSYAAMAAYYAHCLNEYHQDVLGNNGDHPDYGGWITEATGAYSWAKTHVNDEASAEVYNSNKLLAAAAMFLVTQDETYENDFYAAWQNEAGVNDGAWVGPSHNMVAAAMYILNCETFANPSIFSEIEANMISRANRIADHTKNEHYRLGGTESGQWIQMNKYTIPRSFFSIIAYERTGAKKYMDDIYNTANYMLGGNPLNNVKISGIGHNPESAPFYPDAWYLLDYNSKVYTNPMLPGYSVYGRPQFFDVGGPGSETWARSSADPDIKSWNSVVWPMAETRFESRYSIAGSEFTIHQNNLWHILAYGYLCNSGDNFTPNERPTVDLNLAESQDVDVYTPLDLTVIASSDVAKVKYYYDWHFIGESQDAANDFLFTWDVLKSSLGVGDQPVITAVAYDDKGLETLPTDAGDKSINLIFGSSDTTPPTEPGNFKAYNIQSGKADLSWDASIDNNKVDRYAIVNNNSDTLKVVSGSTTSTSLTGLLAGTNYDLKVVAIDPAGNTAESNNQTFTTKSALCGNCNGQLLNGNFSDGLNNWIINDLDKTEVVNDHGRTNVLRINHFEGYAVKQTLSNLCPGTAYRITFQGFIMGGDSKVYLSVSNFGGDSLIVHTKKASWVWETVSIDFTVGANNTTADIYFSRDKWNAGFVDDVVLEQAGEDCPEYTLTISEANGSVIKDPEKSFYYEGEYVNLHPVPDSGFDFIGWTGSFTGIIADTLIRITSNVSVTAHFSNNGGSLDTEAPSVPTDLAVDTAITVANVTWTACTDNIGVTGYKVYLNNNYVATTKNTSYELTGLTAATSYTLSVSAIDAASNESEKAAVEFTTEMPTGIDYMENKMRVAIYPNPADNEIKVVLPQGEHTIEIQTLQGNTIDRMMRQKETAVIDISVLSPGIYLITISNGNNQITKKLIVK